MNDIQDLWKKYSPKPNPWFCSEITYEGKGIAYFENPKGSIEGKTKVSVDESGNLDGSMECEKLDTDAIIHGSEFIKFNKFLQADLSENSEVAVGSQSKNSCSHLLVHTENGNYTSEGKIFCKPGLWPDSKTQFLMSRGIYKEKNGGDERYWVLPLMNFTWSFFPSSQPLLIHHPLRLYLSPGVPEMADEKQRKLVLFIANSRNNLIEFSLGESQGYIEQVLDYDEKVKELKSGKSKSHITALMICENSTNLDKVWFPFDYTNLISFAIGNQVEASWVEFRDDNGKLVKREHFRNKIPEYKKGYAVLDDVIPSGLGQLINLASKSSEFHRSYFRVLISHLVRLQSYSRQIEDCMDLLCRTFDTLCEEYGFSTQNLARLLSEELNSKVAVILKEVHKEVRKLEASAEPAFKPILQQIGSRLANSKNVDRAFGLAVIDLLRKFNLPDLTIMENYYKQYSEFQDKSWIQGVDKHWAR